MYEQIFGAAINAGSGIVNNMLGLMREEKARDQNYKYNEKAAQNADLRTRALYNDFYSPEALMRQYKAAGLSPSLMFGGTPGQGGVSGAQGTGVNQPSTYMPIDVLNGLLVGAQIKNIEALTNKTNAETHNIDQDTILKEIKTKFDDLALTQYNSEWSVLNYSFSNEDDSPTSLFEMADNSYSYESFLNKVRSSKTDESFKAIVNTESGQKQLRSIYTATSKFHHDITILTNEEINSNFQLSIMNALKKEGFVDLNAQAACQQLRAAVETDKLTQEQKGAWNRMIERLGKNGSTTKDIVIVLGMIVSMFANKVPIHVNTGDQNFNKVNIE